MYDSARLGGQVILVVEGEAGPFPLELQAALERVGAETLLARCPARARDLASRFDFSAAAINCGDDHDSQLPARSAFQRFAPVCFSSAITYDSP